MHLACAIFRYFPYGGLQRDFLALVESSLQHGHQVDILTGQWQGKLPEGAKLRQLKLNAFTNHGCAQQFSDHLQKLAGHHTYDAIIGFNKMAGLDLYFAGDACLAGTIPWYKRYLPRYRTYLALENAVFSPQTTTHSWILTPQQQRDFIQQYHTPSTRFTLLAPAVDTRFQQADTALLQRAQWRAEWGLNDHDYFLLCVASYFHTKGVDRAIQLLQALPVALQQRCHLFIVGGDNPKPLLNKRQDGHLFSRIHFIGAQENLLPLYLSADILLHPARQEAAGQVLLEALCCGLPILTTAGCGYSYHVVNAKAGKVIANPWSLNEARCALEEILSIPWQSWRHRILPYKKNIIFQRGEQLIHLVEDYIGAKKGRA